jgi:fumarate hydratase class II
MDAMPVRLDQEFRAWAEQLSAAGRGIESALPRLRCLPIGGTAVGTGINAPRGFGAAVAAQLSTATGESFTAPDGFANLGSQDAAVAFSGQLNVLATALLKLCNDLRWMNSGPLAGLGEITLPALQPGSSIMPGKINPVIPEAVAMACVQVTALHGATTSAGQSGNFQLNVMLPLIADNLLEALQLLRNSCQALAERAISGLIVNEERLHDQLARNPVLVTALNSRIGYERGAAIAKKALAEGRTVLDVALEDTDMGREELETLLDPARLTDGGVPGAD